jgi:hypothetical protein
MSDNDAITGLACAGAVSEDRMQNATPINARTILIILYLRTFFTPGMPRDFAQQSMTGYIIKS